jgi:energy-coupling factor transporter ATP-binding protein EcfA2
VNKLGPTTREQFSRLAREWRQGEHVMVSGPTGSGKTELTRHLDQIRLDAGGHVVVMVGKLGYDETLAREYKGWRRWHDFRKAKRAVSPHDNKILLWPNTDGMRIREARAHQREVFADAFDILMSKGKWTLHVDEGLYTCDPKFLRLSDELAMLHAMGRSSGLTIITLMQRPSNVPLIVYGSASHAFVGQAREQVDSLRLGSLQGNESSRELMKRVSAQGRHDFVWVPVAPDWPAEDVNLRK